MTDLCAIQGQLVDVRNVGTHKCVKLTIHVPAEYAPRVIEAFGWATGVDPVPVAIARMNNGKEANASEDPRVAAKPAPEADNASPVRVPRKWEDVPATTQACIRCNEVPFVKFLNATFDKKIASTKEAAQFVRDYCGVESRRDIRGGEPLYLWRQLDGFYDAWQLAPGVGAA